MNELEQNFAVYKRMARRLPSFYELYGDDSQLHDALQRRDTALFTDLLIQRLWLLACHRYEPLFEAAYGNRYICWDEESEDFVDVWLPVLRQAFLRRKK